MSNKLKRKKKKPKYGWMESEVKNLQKVQDDHDRKAQMLLEVFWDMEEITAYLLHSDLGYQGLRLKRFHSRMMGMMNLCDENKMSAEQLKEYCKGIIGIDPSDIVNRLSLRYKMQLLDKGLPKYLCYGNPAQNISNINEGMEFYFIFALTAIYNQRKRNNRLRSDLSKVKMKEFMDRFVFYTEILEAPQKYGLVISDIRTCLKKECGFTVQRRNLMKDDYLKNVI